MKEGMTDKLQAGEVTFKSQAAIREILVRVSIIGGADF